MRKLAVVFFLFGLTAFFPLQSSERGRGAHAVNPATQDLPLLTRGGEKGGQGEYRPDARTEERAYDRGVEAGSVDSAGNAEQDPMYVVPPTDPSVFPPQ